MAKAESTSRKFLTLPDQAATETLASRLAVLARPGDVIALAGELGTGKSVFARAFLRARGETGEVPSPTFTLVQSYELASATVHHFDLYRLATPEEALELDIEDAFEDGISLIEWPDRLGPLLPTRTLAITLEHGDTPEARHARLAPGGDWPVRLKEAGLA